MKRAHEREIEDGWPLVSWTWDPLIVVDRYRILEVAVGDSIGYGYVEFEEVARSPGKARLVAVPRHTSVVRFSLVREGREWRVLDPREARVSREGLIRCYAYELARADKDWFTGAPLPQLAVYQGYLESLKVLKALGK